MLRTEDVEAAIFDRVEELQRTLPAYGVDRLTPGGLGDLAQRYMVRTETLDEALPLPFLVTPAEGGGLILRRSSQVPTPILWLGTTVACARAAGPVDEAPIISEAAGVIGILPAREMAGPVGRQRLRRREEQLLATPGVMLGRSLSYVLRVAKRVRDSLPHVHALSLLSSDEKVYSLARELRDSGKYLASIRAFQHVAERAVEAADYPTLVKATAGAGRAHYLRGDFGSSRETLLAALSLARMHGVSHQVAMCLHDLFVVDAYSGETVRALETAGEALRSYGRESERLPRLAHDLAEFCNLVGLHEEALTLAAEVVFHAETAGEEASGWGTVAWASGALRQVDRFESAAQRVLAVLGRADCADYHARALLDVARGARGAGQPERGRALALQARCVAAARGESRVLALADEEVSKAPETARAAPAARAVSQPLAKSFVRALRERRLLI
jgi:tetratricopeptide (TPR) repeat protein